MVGHVLIHYGTWCNAVQNKAKVKYDTLSPIVRLRALLIEVFKYVWELDPIFMNILFTLNNKPYDTRSGSLITKSQVKTIKHGINSFVYQGGKQWNALPADAKDIEDLNVFKNYIDKWTGPDCHCGYCVLCAIKTL